MRRIVISLGLAAVATAANAESRNAFLDVSSITGVSVSGGGTDWTVNVGANPSFSYGGSTFDILSVIGFWALSNDGDVVALGSSFGAGGMGGGTWNWDINNADTGGTAGWKINWAGGVNGVDPNHSQNFHFASLDNSTVDQWGFKVVVDGLFPGTTGNTGHITVPEPSTLGAVGIALLGLVVARRRR